MCLKKLDEVRVGVSQNSWRNAREIFFDKKIGELQMLIRHLRLNAWPNKAGRISSARRENRASAMWKRWCSTRNSYGESGVTSLPWQVASAA
jgi:hypothetical protein